MASDAPAPTSAWKAVKPFVNGGASGMLATCIIQPIDMVKVRLQLGATGSPVSPVGSSPHHLCNWETVPGPTTKLCSCSIYAPHGAVRVLVISATDIKGFLAKETDSCSAATCVGLYDAPSSALDHARRMVVPHQKWDKETR